MSRQTRFKPLALRGNEKPRIATTDRLCDLPGCFKYIEAGDWTVRWGTFDLHLTCAGNWCNERGIEQNYEDKV